MKFKVSFITSKGNSISSRVVNAKPQIHLNDSFIETCSSAKLLGVTVNTSLSWSTHIHDVIKKCNSYLYLLSRIKVYLSVDNRKRFYNAYTLSHFDYCCVVWGNCSRSIEETLVRHHLFSKLRWMTFPECVIYQKAIQMFDTIRSEAPDYLQTSFTFSSDVHTKLLWFGEGSNKHLLPNQSTSNLLCVC